MALQQLKPSVKITGLDAFKKVTQQSHANYFDIFFLLFNSWIDFEIPDSIQALIVYTAHSTDIA